MSNLSRRKFLVGGLLAGITATTVHELHFQRQQRQQQQLVSALLEASPRGQRTLLESALNSDVQAAERIAAIQSSIRLSPPSAPYDRDMSTRLIRCCRLGTEQYLFGKFDPQYDGAIAELPSYSDLLRPFRQVASIMGPERVSVRENIEIPPLTAWNLTDPLQERLDVAEDQIRDIAGQVVTVNRLIPVYWGFVLTSPQASIIAFRGTQLQNEWLNNFRAQPVEAAAHPDLNFVGKAHSGFVRIYSSLARETLEAAQALNPSIPCYITGHSLGGALAILAAQHLAQQVPALKPQIRLYTYATPRVGNRVFVEAHSQTVPNSYRVVNLSDAFPLLPPLTLAEYLPVGQEWSFVNQQGDFGANHFISTYREAIDQQREAQSSTAQ